MKNSVIFLFLSWVVLAILDVIGLFTNVPLAFGIAFAVLNATVILGSIPMFIQEFRDRKYQKWAKMNPTELKEKEE